MSPVEEVLTSLLKEDNNIAVTTKCNLNCVFCSRKFNPFVTECSHKDFNFIKAQISLLRPDRQILVNNSISRLTDGEPFTHPRIWDVLELIRKKFPYKHSNRLEGNKIQITTNGSFLTETNLKRLETLGGFIIQHSINTTDKDKWVQLTGSSPKLAEVATSIPNLIKHYNITYLPSIVALPKIVGWEDIEKTIRDLNREGAKTLRLFLPAYTKYASEEEQDMLKCNQEKLRELASNLDKELKINILCYPFYKNNLTPKLKGYENHGILQDDIIHDIDGNKVFSSWHAQFLLLRRDKKTYTVTFERSGMMNTAHLQSENIVVASHADERINIDVDFLPGDVVKVVGDYESVLVLASEAGSVVVRKAFDKALGWEPVLKSKEFFFRAVKSKFFDGSVMCAGLLVCGDYREAIKEFLNSGNAKPDLVLVSQKSFDPLGRDLLKESVYDLSDEFNIPIETL